MDHSFLDQCSERWRSMHFKPGDGDCEHKARANLEPTNDAVCINNFNAPSLKYVYLYALQYMGLYKSRGKFF